MRRGASLVLASFLALLALGLLPACENPFASSDDDGDPGPVSHRKDSHFVIPLQPVTDSLPPAFAYPPPSAPWPTPPPYDLAADLSLRKDLAEERFDGTVPTRVESGVFLLVSPESWELEADGAYLHGALTALLHGRFPRLPSRAVTVWLFHERKPFDALCRERLGDGCNEYLGAWIAETREVLSNQQLGRSTLVHEIAHALLDADAAPGTDGAPAWKPPRWIHEGIAALYELPVVKGTEIHGATNWRLHDLQAALASPVERELVHLDALFRMPDDVFSGEHALAAYAAARFACQWADDPAEDPAHEGRLWRFYRAWRSRAAGDPTGEKAFEETFGQTPHEADDAFQKWMRTLRRAG
jgi:hypothetical protein